MIKTQVDLRNHNIIGRERAALIASTSSRFQSTLTPGARRHRAQPQKHDRTFIPDHSQGRADLGRGGRCG